ncbi:MAG: hypothetical protein M1826_001072 [Phylliscum demangeonii]|nr:MAG: hypothetical protein M1826_001072 [Phylliscum demangeonii]
MVVIDSDKATRRQVAALQALQRDGTINCARTAAEEARTVALDQQRYELKISAAYVASLAYDDESDDEKAEVEAAVAAGLADTLPLKERPGQGGETSGPTTRSADEILCGRLAPLIKMRVAEARAQGIDILREAGEPHPEQALATWLKEIGEEDVPMEDAPNLVEYLNALRLSDSQRRNIELFRNSQE